MKKIILTLIAIVGIVTAIGTTFNVKAANAPELIEGAQIRTDNNAGIKFVANVTPVADATYGMVIARGEVSDLTVETVGSIKGETNTLNDKNQFYVTIVSLPEFAYTQDLSVRAYVLANGEYTYSENIVTRNLTEVAVGAKSNGSSGDFIDKVMNYTYQNYRKVQSDIYGNVYIDNVIYETNHKKLGEAFINDWNTMFGTTLDAETAYVQGTNYASPFRSSAKNNSLTDPTGAKITTFFTNSEMNAKWGWILDYIKNELSAGVSFDPCVTQINCILNNTTDSSGNWYYGLTLISYLQSIFNAKGTSTGSGRFNFENSNNMMKLGLIANYNNTVLADLTDTKLVKKGTNLSLDTQIKDGYVFEGYKANDLTYADAYTVSDEQIMLIPIFTEATVSYDLNGGTMLYDSMDEAIADFINDYNTARGTSYTASEFYALGASADIGGASHVLYGRQSDGTYDNNIKNKWVWLVNYIATVAGANNKNAFVNFYNYSNQSELNSANTNYIYCIAYELRGWVGQAQYTKNSNFKSADYSSSTIKNALNTIIQTPNKEGYEFAGWKSSVDGSITTNFPGYETNVPVTYTAQWKEKSIYVNSNATTGSVYEINGATYVYGIDLFNNINDAIEAASEGSTIRLTAGTHSANVTISKDNITICGPNEGIAYNASRNNEAIISGTISVSANNFTLDGVKYTGTKFTATKNILGLSILNVISTGKVSAFNGGRSAVIGSDYDISNLVIKYSSIKTSSSGSGVNALAFYGVVTNANVEYNSFENTLAQSATNEPILINKVAGKIYVSNNNINWATDNYSIFLGSGANTATVIDIKDNVINCSNTTYHTSGIAVRNIKSGVIVNIVGNKIYNMGGNTFNFKNSVSSAKVNILYNYFDVNTSFKLTDRGSAEVITNNNCYEGGITTATGHTPSTTNETTYSTLAKLEEEYAKIK